MLPSLTLPGRSGHWSCRTPLPTPHWAISWLFLESGSLGRSFCLSVPQFPHKHTGLCKGGIDESLGETSSHREGKHASFSHPLIFLRAGAAASRPPRRGRAPHPYSGLQFALNFYSKSFCAKAEIISELYMAPGTVNYGQDFVVEWIFSFLFFAYFKKVLWIGGGRKCAASESC